MEGRGGEVTGGTKPDEDYNLSHDNPTCDGQQQQIATQPQEQEEEGTKRMEEAEDEDTTTNSGAAIATTDVSSSPDSTTAISTPVQNIDDNDDNHRDVIDDVDDNDGDNDDKGLVTPVRRLDLPQGFSVGGTVDFTKTIDKDNEEDQHPTTPVVTSISAPDLNADTLMPTASARRTTSTTPPKPRITRTPTISLAFRSNKPAGNDDDNYNDIDTPRSSRHYFNVNVSNDVGNNANANANQDSRSFTANSSPAPTITSKSKASTMQTLADLFGGPNAITSTTVAVSAAGNGKTSRNSQAAQHDYTLVGDSPYETTYDPRSPYYYNRIFGQLYITTVSVMFRGKTFGPIGAIPYERRLLLPFVEVSSIEAYRTTSLKIFMDDGEQYVFKSFVDREAVVTLLKRTHNRCCENANNANANHQIGNGRNSRSKSNSPNSSSPFLLEENRTPYTATPTNNDSDNENGNGNGVRRRSLSVPSSLRGSKTARTMPNRNSVVFEDDSAFAVIATPEVGTGNESEYENESLDYTKMPTTSARNSERMPIKSLRLSMSGDGNSNANNRGNRNANANGGNVTAGPRRLFDRGNNRVRPSETTSSAASLMSPPRTTISKRRQPKTPMVLANDGSQIRTKHNTITNNNDGQRLLPLPLQKLKINTSGTVAATIPSIPTVPSLNTPEPRANKNFILLGDETSSESSIPAPGIIPGAPKAATSMSTPTSTSISGKNIQVAFTPRIDEDADVDGNAPFTPIAGFAHATDKINAAVRLNEVDGKISRIAKKVAEDYRSKQLWLAATTQKENEEWKVAMETTKLVDCTLNDWFDLFFSDDAAFSLARYQLEEIGDRDVQFDSWRRKPMQEMDDEDDDGIPELEREIKYIHPINGLGSMIGPSEAETFRRQSLKRYSRCGAVLKNVTTVGKSVPMGDCFRVEDKWIIERHDHKHNNDSDHEHQQDQCTCTLTLSVSFRIVFVKRTMFKSLIQKNTNSETKRWFAGYQAMIQRALSSEEHRERIQLRLRQRNESLAPKAGASEKRAIHTSKAITPSSPSLASVDVSIMTTENSNSKAKNNFETDDTTSASTVNRVPIPDKKSIAIATAHNNKNWLEGLSSPISIAWTPVPFLLATLLTLLVMIFASLWFRVALISADLSAVEEQLEDLKQQNTLLLKEIERMISAVNVNMGATTTEAAADALD